MEVHVKCYSGWQAEEKPKSFRLENREIQVTRILSQWLSPGHKIFKVRGNDHKTYLLMLDTQSWQWTLG